MSTTNTAKWVLGKSGFRKMSQKITSALPRSTHFDAAHPGSQFVPIEFQTAISLFSLHHPQPTGDRLGRAELVPGP